MKSCIHSLLLANFEATIGCIPCTIGCLPEDWQVPINTMIEKKGTGDNVADSQIISLAEGDFNYNNKTLARELLQCAEENNVLPVEQYGSQHNHKAISQAISKKLLCNASHLLRKPITLCSNNAKSCCNYPMQQQRQVLLRLNSPFSSKCSDAKNRNASATT